MPHSEVVQRFGFWIGVVLVYTSVVLGSLTFFDATIGIPATFPVIAGFFLAAGCYVWGRGLPGNFEPSIAVVTALVLLCSDVLWRATGTLQAMEVGAGIKILVVLAAGALAFVPRIGLSILLTVSIASSLIGYFRESNGHLLFSDDHPAFMYRIHQLVSYFPHIPYFNTEWNGGVEAREFFPSGVLNLFLLWAPVFYFLGVQESYTVVIALTLFVLAPLFAVCAARLAGLTIVGSSAAGILSLLPTLLWYRWALKYGTMGFVVAGMLLPLTIVLAHRFSRRGQFGGGAAVETAVPISLMALWSLSNIAALPAYLAMIARPRLVFGDRSRILTLTLLVILNLPWMVMFLKFSPVAKFVRAETVQAQQLVQDSRAGTDSNLFPVVKDALGESIEKLRGFAATASILLLIGSFGIFFFEKSLATLFGVQLLWLVSLGTLGEIVLPHLELNRMLVMAACVVVIPAARLVEVALARYEKHSLPTFISGCAFITPLCFVPYGMHKVVSNRTFEHYSFAKPVVGDLIAAAREHDSGGRLLIAGFVLHEWSNGHVAPLPWLSGRPVVAMSYQHDRWEHEDVVPPYYRKKGEAGVLEYLNLLDVSEVVTHEPGWRGWYSKRPHLFESVWRGGRFTLFRRLAYVPTRILEGKGELISETPDGFRVKVESERVVLKYSYLPFLQSDGCSIGSKEVDGGVVLVELSSCKIGSIVSVRAKSALERLF